MRFNRFWKTYFECKIVNCFIEINLLDFLSESQKNQSIEWLRQSIEFLTDFEKPVFLYKGENMFS